MTTDDSKEPISEVAARPTRRRRRQEGGRPIRPNVRLTVEEDARLQILAAAQHVSVPKLLIDSALSGSAVAAVQQQELVQELFKMNRLLANIANNVNQIAHATNTASKAVRKGEVNADIEEMVAAELPRLPAVTAAVRKVALRIEDVLDEMGN